MASFGNIALVGGVFPGGINNCFVAPPPIVMLDGTNPPAPSIAYFPMTSGSLITYALPSGLNAIIVVVPGAGVTVNVATTSTDTGISVAPGGFIFINTLYTGSPPYLYLTCLTTTMNGALIMVQTA